MGAKRQEFTQTFPLHEIWLRDGGKEGEGLKKRVRARELIRGEASTPCPFHPTERERSPWDTHQ